MLNQNKNNVFFDSSLKVNEQLPREFTVSFKESENSKTKLVIVKLNGEQLGDLISDNSYENDFYRYHDIFHYTFATILKWSPCTRAMMKKKRKSNPLIDEMEDGARATITEEAISLILFNEAKRKNLFENNKRINKSTLRIIKEMTEGFEVKHRTEKEWQNAILKGYDIFRLLIKNKGGEVHFDMMKQKVEYTTLN
jgi:hypothetical protein